MDNYQPVSVQMMVNKMGSCVVYEPLDRYVGRHLDRLTYRSSVGRHIDLATGS